MVWLRVENGHACIRYNDLLPFLVLGDRRTAVTLGVETLDLSLSHIGLVLGEEDVSKVNYLTSVFFLVFG